MRVGPRSLSPPTTTASRFKPVVDPGSGFFELGSRCDLDTTDTGSALLAGATALVDHASVFVRIYHKENPPARNPISTHSSTEHFLGPEGRELHPHRDPEPHTDGWGPFLPPVPAVTAHPYRSSTHHAPLRTLLQFAFWGIPPPSSGSRDYSLRHDAEALRELPHAPALVTTDAHHSQCFGCTFVSIWWVIPGTCRSAL